jgi:phage protein D
MPHGLEIEVNGAQARDLYADIVSVEVEDGDTAPATFQITLALAKQPEAGRWRHLDDDRLRVWNRVTIRAGFRGGPVTELISGYITWISAAFTDPQDHSVLQISGLDASVLMDREEKLRAWPNKKDSDIAREILTSYGFTPKVTDTDIVHDEAVSTVTQRATDLQFLQRLAKRNGFRYYHEGTTGNFGPLPTSSRPQPVLAAHFGKDTNLVHFTATVDALRPSDVAMYQIDRFNKEMQHVEATSGTREMLGRLDADALLRGDVRPARVYVAKNPATGTPEMSALCQGLVRDNSWFVHGEGEIDGAAYAHVLRPRALVTIKGVGETYSGTYYVQFVRHIFARDCYSARFRVQRDALFPTGREDFSSSGTPALL